MGGRQHHETSRTDARHCDSRSCSHCSRHHRRRVRPPREHDLGLPRLSSTQLRLLVDLAREIYQRFRGEADALSDGLPGFRPRTPQSTLSPRRADRYIW
jgi:hypothetical protein